MLCVIHLPRMEGEVRDGQIMFVRPCGKFISLSWILDGNFVFFDSIKKHSHWEFISRHFHRQQWYQRGTFFHLVTPTLEKLSNLTGYNKSLFSRFPNHRPHLSSGPRAVAFVPCFVFLKTQWIEEMGNFSQKRMENVFARLPNLFIFQPEKSQIKNMKSWRNVMMSHR